MLERFREVFNKAVDEKSDTFKFDGSDYVTGYAKYLIAYLDSILTNEFHENSSQN